MAGKQERETTWRIYWRQADRPGRQYETFGTEAKADSFRAQVEAAGNRWPDGWVRGKGYAGAVVVGAPEAGGAHELAALTVADWCRRTADDPRRKLTEGTRQSYHKHIRLYIESCPIGKMAAATVTTEDVYTWLDMLYYDRNMSHKSITTYHSQVSVALGEAVRAGAIPSNPAYKAVIPGDADGARPAYFARDWEVDAVVAAMYDLRPLFGLVTQTLAETGMRWSEMRALTAGDVFESPDGRHYVTIDKARKYQRTGARPVGKPKTRAGSRTISLPRQLGAELYKHAIACAASADKLFDLPGDARFAQVWRKARVIAGVHNVGTARGKIVGMRIHDLRHYHASWLLANGAELFKVSKRLGHANLNITSNLYGHLASQDEGIIQIIDTPRRTRPLRVAS